MVLWKDKQNQQAFKQNHQEKKQEDPNKHNQEWKRRDNDGYHRNTKDCKKLLRRTTWQEIWKLGEMENFLEKYNALKLNEKEAESLNRSITASEIQALMKRLSAYKSPGLNVYTGEFHKTFKEELTPILLILLQKNPRKGKTPKLFLRSQHHPNSKTR